jgi:hypothetical protein
MKKLIEALVCYLAAASALGGSLVSGMVWLTRADGAVSAPVHVARIPPRIADSIERKKAFVPPQAVQAPSVLAKPMRESNVSLSQPVATKWSIRQLSPPPVVKRNPTPVRAPSDVAEATRFNAMPTPVRSDNFSGL